MIYLIIHECNAFIKAPYTVILKYIRKYMSSYNIFQVKTLFMFSLS